MAAAPTVSPISDPIRENASIAVELEDEFVECRLIYVRRNL